MTSKLSSVSSDPLLTPLQPADNPVAGSSKATTLTILNQAFPDPVAAQQIYNQKLEHKPLSVNPADSTDARTARRRKRLSQLKRKRKPKSLSAKEKRELRIYDIPKSEIRFPFRNASLTSSHQNFTPLNTLWNKYISEIVPLGAHEPTTAANGATLLKADYHGALMMVEGCRCKSRIGISGICVKETKNMFEIVTFGDKLLKIPKENSLFRVTAKFDGGRDDLEWRLWGDQFLLRSGERAGRKFSGRTIRGKGPLEL